MLNRDQWKGVAIAAGAVALLGGAYAVGKRVERKKQEAANGGTSTTDVEVISPAVKEMVTQAVTQVVEAIKPQIQAALPAPKPPTA